ncbi:MAG: hypothetical protein U0984_00920 [Prosthecobacter sp.]|nr:hypothetical protein [Prosthecobacter sp.]
MTAVRRKTAEDSLADEAREPVREWRSLWSLDDEWEDEPLRKPVAREIEPPPRRAPKALVVPAMTSRAEPPKPKPSVAADEAAIRLAQASRSSAQALAATVAAPVPPPEPVTAKRRPAAEKAPAAKGPAKPPAKTAPQAVYKHPTFSWWTPAVLSLGLLGMTFLVWIYWHDAPLGTDEDLRLALPVDQAVSISTPRRLRAFLDSIAPADDPTLVGLPAWQWNTPALARLIGLNGAAFDNLRDLLEDYDWHPRHATWYVADLVVHDAWPHVAILLQAQAAYLTRRGDEEGAFTTAIDLAEFSRRLQDLWSWPSFAGRSGNLHAASVQTLAELLKRTHLDSKRLGEFQKEFADCAPSREMLQDALNAYYIHEKKLLLGAESGELLDTMPRGIRQARAGRLFFKMNQTLNLFAGAFRELKTEVTAKPYAAFGLTGERVRHTRQTAPQFYQPNATGERYFSDRIDSYLDLPENQTLARTHHQLVLCLFAIRRHVVDHQRLPATLLELRPTYLAEIPNDPFSGEALRYDSTKGRLFSVGINHVAEGGLPTQPPLNDPKEPTVELGIAAAAVVK